MYMTELGVLAEQFRLASEIAVLVVPESFSTALAPMVSVPAPDSAVLTVRVGTLVATVPVTAILVSVSAAAVPPIAVLLPEKVYTPVLAVKTLLFVKLPPKVIAATAVLLQVPLLIKSPVNIAAPVLA